MFTRSGGVWRQQGNKLVGTGAAGSAHQGISVALSADGNTAIVGGARRQPGRSIGTIRSRGSRGSVDFHPKWWCVDAGRGQTNGVAGSARQGLSVALSADGNTALVGGLVDDGGVGAASVFTRSSGHWTQNKKLVGTGAIAASSVALSGDGSIAMIGASNDSGGVGATWVFARSSP